MFKSSAKAGTKDDIKVEAVDITNDSVIIVAIRMRDNKQILCESIKEKDLNIDRVRESLKVTVTDKEPSAIIEKTKGLASEVAEVTSVGAKSVVIGTSHAIEAIGAIFSKVRESMNEAAEEYDQKKVEKAAKIVESAKK